MIIRQPLSNYPLSSKDVNTDNANNILPEVTTDDNYLVVIEESTLEENLPVIIQDVSVDPEIELIVSDNYTTVIKETESVDTYDSFTTFDDSVIVVKDTFTKEITQDFITNKDTLILKDAGPVFIGPVGPIGPDIYQAWINQGNTGSFNDFLETIRVGLGNDAKQTFVFIQNTASKVWVINHGLNRYPMPIFEDSAGEIFDADFKYIDKNTIEVKIISPNAGKAYLN
jgi:hypothetical protein